MTFCIDVGTFFFCIIGIKASGITFYKFASDPLAV